MTPEAAQRAEVWRPVLEITVWAWMGVVALQVLGLSATTDTGPDPSGFDRSAHAHHHTLVASGPTTAGVDWLGVVGFALMVSAMMAPLLIPPLQHVLSRSLPARRGRHTLLLVAAQLLVWVPAMALLQIAGLGVTRVLGEVTAGLVVLGAGVSLALLWEVSPGRQHCLNRHHAHPTVAAFGAAADRSVITFGLTHATWCLGTCWAIMLLPNLAGVWHLPVMALASGWMWLSMVEGPGRRRWGVPFFRSTSRLARAVLHRRRYPPA